MKRKLKNKISKIIVSIVSKLKLNNFFYIGFEYGTGKKHIKINFKRSKYQYDFKI